MTLKKIKCGTPKTKMQMTFYPDTTNRQYQPDSIIDHFVLLALMLTILVLT